MAARRPATRPAVVLCISALIAAVVRRLSPIQAVAAKAPPDSTSPAPRCPGDCRLRRPSFRACCRHPRAGAPHGRRLLRGGSYQILLGGDHALGYVREVLPTPMRRAASCSPTPLLSQLSVRISAQLTAGGALAADEVQRVLHVGAALGGERRRRVGRHPRSGGRPIDVPHDGARSGVLCTLQARRCRDTADGAGEGRRIDIGVVLVEAVDGGRQHAVASVRLSLGVVQGVAAARPPAVESQTPSASVIGSQMVSPPGDVAPRSASGMLSRGWDQGLPAEQWGAEFAAGDAVRLFAGAADEAVSSSRNSRCTTHSAMAPRRSATERRGKFRRILPTKRLAVRYRERLRLHRLQGDFLCEQNVTDGKTSVRAKSTIASRGVRRDRVGERS